MQALVTGVAGFIGSTLAGQLLRDGWSVRGIDAFTDYYEPDRKRSNVADLNGTRAFELVEADLTKVALEPLLEDVTVVFHQAAQPGVRLSWAEGFNEYVRANIEVTQRLLEAVRRRPVERFVYASSSSVYGEAANWPTAEEDATRPFSPYGVTKLAGEHLCRAYAANFEVPTVSLRYFTVYGPRQRPDMATYRLIECSRHQRRFPLFGDGGQIRDFTYVEDVVAANVLAATQDVPSGSVFNVAGGGSTRLIELVSLVGELVGHEVPIDWQPAEPGDVSRTGGDAGLAQAILGWVPRVGLGDGLARQVEWHQANV